MPRILGLDIGERRIGVALSDAMNIIAMGMDTIDRKNEKNVVEKIKKIVEQHDVSKIIVGMPFNMNGTKGDSARSVESFIESLKKEIFVEIEFLDERLTTVQGERILLEADISRAKRRLSIDKISSQIILQTYLDSNVQKNKS